MQAYEPACYTAQSSFCVLFLCPCCHICILDPFIPALIRIISFFFALHLSTWISIYDSHFRRRSTKLTHWGLQQHHFIHVADVIYADPVYRTSQIGFAELLLRVAAYVGWSQATHIHLNTLQPTWQYYFGTIPVFSGTSYSRSLSNCNLCHSKSYL